MSLMSPAVRILVEIILYGVLEDRRNYDLEDLQTTYNIDNKVATELYQLIREALPMYNDIERMNQ